MKFPRRRFLHLAAATAVVPAVTRIARAQIYPSRPITMVVPAAAGGRPILSRASQRRPCQQPLDNRLLSRTLGAQGEQLESPE